MDSTKLAMALTDRSGEERENFDMGEGGVRGGGGLRPCPGRDWVTASPLLNGPVMSLNSGANLFI
jgi:hypothetical protein